MENKLIIYCDGGSRGNPGPCASAFVVTRNNIVMYKKSKYFDIETNNFAEYQAVLMAVEWIVSQSEILNSKFQILINLDSQLVQRQLNGIYKIKSLKLRKIVEDIINLIKTNDINIKFDWNYRSKNFLADELVNQELNNRLQREK